MPRQRKKSVFIPAVVEFVNDRYVRVRSDQGKTYLPDLGRYSTLLPNDKVEVELVLARGSGIQHSQVVDVEWRKSYQIVAQVRRKRIKSKHRLVLNPVGIGLDIPINAKQEQIEFKHRDYVLATVTRRKHRPSDLELTRIEKRLENVNELANAVAMSRYGISRDWAIDVSAELDGVDGRITDQILESRADLRDLPFVTIDPSSAKDHDDAVFCQRLDDGIFRLLVAIADVSEYVLPSTGIDAEAKSRGNSIYFLNDVIPMLPEQLSNDICSLRPEQDRLAVVCDMRINSSGAIESYEFKEAVIASSMRLSYHSLQGLMERGDISDAVLENLRCLYELHGQLLTARSERGTLEVDMPTSVFALNESGAVESIRKSKRVEAHSIIEEAMLSANVCAANFIDEHYAGIAMFRVHGEPDLRDIVELNGILADHHVQLPLDRKIEIADYEMINEALANKPTTLFAIQTHILRSLSTAVYTELAGPHFALSYEKYTHFTSPIRRYPDLVVHRFIKNVIRKSKPKIGKEKLAEVAELCSYTERRADACAREAEKWIKAEYMRSRINEEFDGIVVDVRKFGVFVHLDDPFLSGMISIYGLGMEYFWFDHEQRQLVGDHTGTTFHIGLAVRVRVTNADPENGFIDLSLISIG